jgi:hypothetical protein
LLGAAAVMILVSRLVAFADLDETKKAVETRYTDQDKEQRSEAAVPPASEMIEFNLAFVSKSGKYARVWFKDDRSVMESHIASRGLADYEIDSLRDRNVGKSEWLPVPLGRQLVNQRNQIWLRKDRLVAAFLVRNPSPGATRLNWLATSFTVGYIDVLKAQINQGELVGDAAVTRQLWKKLEEFLKPAK